MAASYDTASSEYTLGSFWSYPVKLQNTWSVLSLGDFWGKARLILESREWIISGNFKWHPVPYQRRQKPLYPRKSKPLCISRSLPAFPGTHTQARHCWLFLQHHLTEVGDLEDYLPQRPAQEVRQIWGKGTQTSADSMSHPYPSNPCEEISLCTAPVPEIAGAGCSIASFLPFHLKITLFPISVGMYILIPRLYLFSLTQLGATEFY